MHRYYLTQRPVSVGAQPKGFCSLSNDPGELPGGIKYYGYVEYQRDLTPREVEDYELYDGNNKIKTLDGWRGSGADSFYDYAQPGDIVDRDTVDYFIDCMPPRSMTYGYVQMGEPYSSRFDEYTGKYRSTYLTFFKEGQNWIYQGTCFGGGLKNIL